MELGGNRIHGTETEWSIQIEHPMSTPEKPANTELNAEVLDIYVAQYLEDKPYVGTPHNCYLENGSRFYGDINNKRETTTPEDTSYLSTTASEIANERMLLDILTTATYADEMYEHAARLPNFLLFKWSTDGGDCAWAYHESYNIPSSVSISREGLPLYAIHNSTRNIFCGAGLLGPGGTYYSAQKALFAQDEFGASTTRNRPVVNTKQEPLGDARTTGRVHNIIGDPSMSPWVTRMQLGTTALVLEMQAQGIDAREFNFAPLNRGRMALFMRNLAHDTDGTSSEFAESLRQQKLLLARARTLPNLTNEQEWTMEEWDHVLFDLEHDWEAATKRVEWMMRARILERLRKRHGYAWNSPEMRRQDRRFCKIGAASIGLALRETTWSEWMPPEDLIRARQRGEAPQNTRAAIRGEFVRAFGYEHGNDSIRADWDSVGIGPDPRITIKLPDPAVASNRNVTNLVRTHAPRSKEQAA